MSKFKEAKRNYINDLLQQTIANANKLYEEEEAKNEAFVTSFLKSHPKATVNDCVEEYLKHNQSETFTSAEKHVTMGLKIWFLKKKLGESFVNLRESFDSDISTYITDLLMEELVAKIRITQDQWNSNEVYTRDWKWEHTCSADDDFDSYED